MTRPSGSIACRHGNGWRSLIGERRATRVAGTCCNGRPLDCQIDYLQFCHRRSLLDRFEGSEWWPEEKETESHADGIFLERCGRLTPSDFTTAFRVTLDWMREWEPGIASA